jgi:2',3'-cyclic-nucleotide 2'-phosphodiesterase (5'-nucleotidase family)
MRQIALLAALLVATTLAGCSPTRTAHLAETTPVRVAGSDTLRLVVMATTDLHGYVLPWNYYADAEEPLYGLAKVATLVDSIRAHHPHTLLLDAGDWLQGNPMAEYFARADTLAYYPLLQAVDAMGYDALVLGNHEFNFGIDLLARRIEQTVTPIIAANIYRYGTEEHAYTPYVIREVGSVRVGIVGLTTPGSAVWDRPRVQGRLAFGDGLDAARRYVREVREQGAEVVVVLAHSGLEGPTSYDMEGTGLGEENFGRVVIDRIRGVDAVVLGHAHRQVEEVIQGAGGHQVAVVMPGRWASHLGVAELAIVRGADGVARVVDRSARLLSVEHVAPHPEIEALAADAHEAVRAYMRQPLATTPEPWPTLEARLGPSAAVGLIHRVQLEATGAQLSAAAAFTTNLTLGPGAITLGQVTQLYPYENALYVVEISGADLREYIEHGARYFRHAVRDGEAPTINPQWPGYNFDMIAGAEYELDLTQPRGARVVRLEVDGQPVADDDTFTMAVNSYRAEGGGGFPGMGDARIIRRLDRSVRDLIAEYLREQGTIRPSDVLERNWSLSPRPE